MVVLLEEERVSDHISRRKDISLLASIILLFAETGKEYVKPPKSVMGGGTAEAQPNTTQR